MRIPSGAATAPVGSASSERGEPRAASVLRRPKAYRAQERKEGAGTHEEREERQGEGAEPAGPLSPSPQTPMLSGTSAKTQEMLQGQQGKAGEPGTGPEAGPGVEEDGI